MEESVNATLFEKLKTLRRARGLSVQKLAEKMGENHQKVGRMERGQTNLTIDYLLKLSKALETPVDTLINDKPSELKPPVKDDPNLLSTIVLWVEKNTQTLSLHHPERKAEIVSRLYAQTLKVPQEVRKLFLETLCDALIQIKPH